MKNVLNAANWVSEGERQFRSASARRIIGIENRATWNQYLISIGKETGEYHPVLTMTDLVWIWTLRLWLKQNRRKTRESTHQTFRYLRENSGWNVDRFLAYMDTSLNQVVNELRYRIEHQAKLN